MDKKHKNTRNSLKKASEFQPEKVNKFRTINGCTPKDQETSIQKRCLQHAKTKIYHFSSQKAIKTSVLLQLPFRTKEREFNRLREFQSNNSYVELPLSPSEKTIKFVKSIEKKANTKLTKGKRKPKINKAQKEEQKAKISQKSEITRRKVIQTKDDYEILYRKTEQILKEYQERQSQWQRQKTILMEQLQDVRRKSMGMALTNCSSYSINRRNFF